MRNEMMVQSGAAEAADEAKHNPDRALTSKIARLPKEIREEFNRRLEDNPPAAEILSWVNGLPATMEILAKYFRGVPISDANLSQWRQGGYKRWQEKQESKAELTEMVEDAGDLSEIAAGKLARGTASLAMAKILKTLQAIPATADSLDGLTKISYAVTALLHAEQSQVRLEYEKARVCQGNERLVLSWDKFLRDCIDAVQRALTDQIAKDIQAANIDNGEKIELLGHHMFGRKWKGRAVGKKGEAKKEAEGSKKEGAEPEKAEAQTADQQVRPTTAQGHRTEAKDMDAQQRVPTTIQNDSTKLEKTDALERVPTTVQGHCTVPEKMDAEMADQQVRPTTIQGHRTEARVSGGEKARELKVSGSLPTAATKGEAKKMDATQRVPTTIQNDSTKGEPKKAVGQMADQQVRPTTIQSVSTKAKVLADKKAVELSPYDKALLEGKTHLEAMYAQYSRINHPAPKPPVDPLQPKPNPLDTFSEPVKKSPFASLHGLLRQGSLWGSTLG